jgi:hypothetical protein
MIKLPRFTKSRTLAEITKTAIITGNISRAKNVWHLLSDYWQQEAMKLNCYFQCLSFFGVLFYGNAPLHYFNLFQNH